MTAEALRDEIAAIVIEMREPHNQPKDYFGVSWADRLDAALAAVREAEDAENASSTEQKK